MNIAGRVIGPTEPPLVIAEIGINHEGSLATALQMVDAAAAAGAEVIKHQTHIVEDEMSDEARSVVPGNTNVSIYEVMERCALSENDELALKDYVESKGLIFISTPFSRAAADRLQRMDVSAFKIGSGECNNYPLIKYIAEFGKPIILSTGMNDIPAIKKSVDIIKSAGVDLALLHTTNIYPTPEHLVRLNAMVDLQKAFPDVVVGLSDHTTSNYACFGAIALGASILERHFTDRMDRPGPDIVCSMDGEALRDLIRGANAIYLERDGTKVAVIEEKPTIDFAFASVVSTKHIRRGDLLTEDNIWVKRPGTGDFLAEDYEQLLGQVAREDIPANVQIAKTHIAGS